MLFLSHSLAIFGRIYLHTLPCSSLPQNSHCSSALWFFSINKYFHLVRNVCLVADARAHSHTFDIQVWNWMRLCFVLFFFSTENKNHYFVINTLNHHHHFYGSQRRYYMQFRVWTRGCRFCPGCNWISNNWLWRNVSSRRQLKTTSQQISLRSGDKYLFFLQLFEVDFENFGLPSFFLVTRDAFAAQHGTRRKA